MSQYDAGIDFWDIAEIAQAEESLQRFISLLCELGVKKNPRDHHEQGF